MRHAGHRLQRRVAQQVELPQRLEVHRIEVGALAGEFLARLQQRPAQRGPGQHALQEVLAQQVGGAVPVARSVGDGGAAEEGAGAVGQVAQGHRPVAVGQRRIEELRAIAAFRGDDGARGDPVAQQRRAHRDRKILAPLAVVLRHVGGAVAVDEVHAGRQIGLVPLRSVRRRQAQPVRVAEGVGQAEPRRALPDLGRQREAVHEGRARQALVAGRRADQLQQQVGPRRPRQVGQPPDDPRRPEEPVRIGRVGGLAGVGQVAGDDAVLVAQFAAVRRILQRHHRQQVGAAQQHQVVGLAGAGQRVDGRLQRLGVGPGRHRRGAVGLHRRGEVDRHHQRVDAAPLVRGGQRLQRRVDLRQRGGAVLGAQRAAMNDDQLVHVKSLPVRDDARKAGS